MTGGQASMGAGPPTGSGAEAGAAAGTAAGIAGPAISAEAPSAAGAFPDGHPRSYWAATAAGYVPRPSLDGDLDVDVAVVGGGFTGLAAAYHLLEYGYRTAVLERHRVGWGASGRNAGFLLTGYKWS